MVSQVSSVGALVLNLCLLLQLYISDVLRVGFFNVTHAADLLRASAGISAFIYQS